MRKLTLEDVTISVTTEEEDVPVRDNALASGDADADREEEDAILARLKRGDYEAWCRVIVTATWEAPDGNEYTGQDSLGCCVLGDGYTAEQCAEHHDMAEQALNDLNQRLACIVSKARRLKEALS